MSAAKRKDNTLWIAIAVALVLAGVVFFALTHVRLPEVTDAKPIKTATAANTIVTRIEAGNTLLLEDKTPLFLPTAVNSSAPSLPAGFRREPDRALKPLPPWYKFGAFEMNVAMPEAIPVPPDAVQTARVGDSPNPFFAFGRMNIQYTPLSQRLAQLEVVQSRTGRIILAAPLNALPEDKLPAVDWQPLEMVVAVEASGTVGEPTVTSGSGFEEVDRYFCEILLHRFRIGARLPPGFYTLRVGP